MLIDRARCGSSGGEEIDRTTVHSKKSKATTTSGRSVKSAVSGVGSAISGGNRSGMSLLDTRLKRQYVSSDRPTSRRVPKNKRRRKALDEKEMVQSFLVRCCLSQCIVLVSLDDLRWMRHKYIPLSQSAKDTAVMNIIKASRLDKRATRVTKCFLVDTGQTVCRNVVSILFGISIRHFAKLAARVREGQTTTFRLPRSHESGIWRDVMIPWVKDFANRFGNHMPDTDKIELSCGTKYQVYNKFHIHVEGLRDMPKPLSDSWFYRLWVLYLPKITTPKRNRFTKCDFCILFKDRLEREGYSSHEVRVKWVQEFDEHLEHQMLERKQYYRNRDHARAHPEECMSIIIDGMGSNITNIPFYPHRKPKSMFGKEPFDLHVMGVMIHGFQPRAFIHDSRIGTGPNLICECIWRTIRDVEVDKLPPKLYIQLDNTASDNKNHHVLEFCSFLVENGYFKEVSFCVKIFLHLFYLTLARIQVIVGFMMVGHTHDDIDQMFSRFTTGMRNSNYTIYSVRQLAQVFVDSFTPAVNCEYLDGIMDWKGFLNKHSKNQLGAKKGLHGHLRPHQFHFFMNTETNRCEMKFKRWARNPDWFPSLPTTPKIFLLHDKCDLANLKPLPLIKADEDKVDNVCNTFKIAAKYGIPDCIIEQQVEYTQGWGDASPDSPPSPDQEEFCDIAEGKKYAGVIVKVEGNGDESKVVEQQITEEDVLTDDELLVYQGNLHSKDKDAVTNKANFVDVNNILDEQLVLVRGDDDAIFLCKVKSVSIETREVRVHWYDGRSLRHAQVPMYKKAAVQNKNSKKKKGPKNVPYIQSISIDSILVSKPFALNKTKSVPKHIQSLAERRLKTVLKVVDAGAAAASSSQTSKK